jgi:hypothetical protein
LIEIMNSGSGGGPATFPDTGSPLMHPAAATTLIKEDAEVSACRAAGSPKPNSWRVAELGASGNTTKCRADLPLARTEILVVFLFADPLYAISRIPNVGLVVAGLLAHGCGLDHFELPSILLFERNPDLCVLEKALASSQLITCVEELQGGGAEDIGRSFHPTRKQVRGGKQSTAG